ncbi:MAG TPA: LysM peptidoglycan-binding domain-containing protein [Gammaproteobacteria bacterium]|nr:LysM peptidoglycan-binding domain-containing protein [Gammaproteobacteria bacterium]
MNHLNHMQFAVLIIVALSSSVALAIPEKYPFKSIDHRAHPVTDSNRDLLRHSEQWERIRNQEYSWEPSYPQSSVSDTAIDALPPGDLWDRLREGFHLQDHNHPGIRSYLDWYARNQAYLDRVAERARPFLYDIVQEVERRGMPGEIALLPVVESAFQPFAYSAGRAAGIWQFIPATGRHYGLKQNWWYDGRRDVRAATRAALDYLQHLNTLFDGDWLLALAAYNSGEGRVQRAIRANRKKGKATDFWSLDLPKETRGYVPKLLAISTLIETPGHYGVRLISIPDRPQLAEIDIGSQIDLALAAELAGLSIEEIYRLNPAYNRWATAPDGPHRLLLPIDKAEAFRHSLAELGTRDRVRWERHRIKPGENLGGIARRYQTSVALLQEVNQIRGQWIRAGDTLMIPIATKNLSHYLSEDRRKQAIQDTQRRGNKIHHTVRSGDTWWDLSRKHGVTTNKLARWNSMSPRDPLFPGQQLVIWSRGNNLLKTNFTAALDGARHQKIHYRVRKGDSLARIAKRFSVTIAKLRRWNALQKGKYLQPGQRLTLYVDITRQS